MAVQAATVVLIFAVLLLLLPGIILSICGIATPKWIQARRDGEAVHFGLFTYCMYDGCFPYSESPEHDGLRDTVGFSWNIGTSIVGVIFECIALICGLATLGKLCTSPLKTIKLPSIVLSTSFAGAAAILVGIIKLAIAMGSVDDAMNVLEFGMSYYLCLAGALTCALGGVVAFACGKNLLMNDVYVSEILVHNMHAEDTGADDLSPPPYSAEWSQQSSHGNQWAFQMSQQTHSPAPQQHAQYPAPQQHAQYPAPQQHAQYPAPQQHAQYPAPQQRAQYPAPYSKRHSDAVALPHL